MNPIEFLNAELDHAQRHLARVRRIQAKMLSDLEATGLDEVKAYEQLAANKAHRQLQRDEAFYQQMWLRLERALQRHQPKTTQSAQATPDQQQAKPQTVRYTTPLPGRNSLCPCGSTLKYKRCCGNPVSPHRAAA